MYDGKGEAAGRIYPCAKCGKMRSKAEGGTTFTVCDECWDEAHPDAPTHTTGEAVGREALVSREEAISVQVHTSDENAHEYAYLVVPMAETIVALYAKIDALEAQFMSHPNLDLRITLAVDIARREYEGQLREAQERAEAAEREVKRLREAVDPDTCCDCGKRHTKRDLGGGLCTWADPDDGHYCRPAHTERSWLNHVRDILAGEGGEK